MKMRGVEENVREGAIPSRRLWITWEMQRRNRSLSRAVGAELLELINDRGRLLRYLVLVIRTIRELQQRRPRVLFCQSPSIVLAALCAGLRPWFRYLLVIDAHNSGVSPLEGRSALLNALAGWSLRRADIVLVSNSGLARRLRSRIAAVLPVPDPLPDLSVAPGSANATSGGVSPASRVLFVCSWHADEPVDEVLEAATLLDPNEVRLQITGRSRVDSKAVPPAVDLLGFLPESSYVQALRGASLVIALTRREDNLNCAAYEAVAAGTPGILTDTAALREHFPGGFLFVRPEPRLIAKSIQDGLACRSRLAAALEESRRRIELRVRDGLREMEAALEATAQTNALGLKENLRDE